MPSPSPAPGSTARPRQPSRGHRATKEPSMADLLSTGVSGLLAAQVGLSTTGHNVSNANTDGYSRQQVTFAARAPQAEGRYYVGTGVDTQAVQRAYSQYLNTALWSASSSKGRADAYQSLTDQLNKIGRASCRERVY